MIRAGDRAPSPRRVRNRLLAALTRAGREVDAATGIGVELLDGAGRWEALALAEALLRRARGLRRALRKAEAAEVARAGVELHAEASRTRAGEPAR